MKKLIWILLLCFVLASCSELNTDWKIQTQVTDKTINENNDEKKTIENFLWESHLLVEDWVLYCVFGDINNPNHNAGYIYNKQKIDNISNPLDLEKIDFTYYKDKNYVYYHETPCTIWAPWECSCYFTKEKYDVSTFKSLGYFYYKDKNGIYNGWFDVEWADADSFKTVALEWYEYDAKDKDNFYLEWNTIGQ